MDAKSKANFINSIASGETTVCPKCGAANKAQMKFCISCGTELTKKAADTPQTPQTPVIPGEPETSQASQTSQAPAFKPITESETPEPIKAPVEIKKEVYVEQKSVFAKGLPEWTIEPPQIMVRRKRG